ncbi:DEAD/DEAH box helicase [Nocardioides dongxiaopingii]|uniref:DEAD/DEAH box helicase n=1 Tax=Nocardioides sp. S-1144 TaxID=2582905 RepID=UPI00110E98B3|nr:DEAD/DEAH box helicase [Nocardioides sp. S-1144]QCW50540.1 DEAD/DEAH box helicase [Nocardioides sp. S-1144]
MDDDMDLLRQLIHEHLDGLFDRGTLHRAQVYVDERLVSAPTIVAESETHLTATARVHSSGGAPYLTRLTVRLAPGVLDLSTICSCPVRFDCKHGAALAMVLAAGSDEPVADDWRHRLDVLLDELGDLAPPAVDPTPLALQLTWGVSHDRYRYSQAPDLRLRPMRLGKRGRWIKSGIGWSDLPGARVRREHLAAHLDVLASMASGLERHGGYWYAGREPSAGDFGPDVVPLLVEARSAGVRLLLEGVDVVDLVDKPVAPVADLSAGHPADATGDGTTRLVVGLDHDGRVWHGDRVRFWGEPAHTALLHTGEGAIALARLARRLPRGPVRAITGDPLEIPVGAAGELATGVERLRRLVPLGSRDGSVEVPEPVRPRLRLTVVWHGADRADLAWSWRYGEHDVALDQPDAVRDHRAERDLLAALPQPPDTGRHEVSGVDALHLTLLELPSWRDCDDVDVVEVGAPSLRESVAEPEIRFDVAPPGDAALAATTDWLDLAVSITVDGEHVPLAAVLAALTLGDELVILPSGLFFSTDRPEFARLAALVHDAATLRERDDDDDRISVGQHDLGTWAELADLGVVDDQAEEWVRRARALRDLVDLPRPEPTGVVSTLRGYQRDGFHWLAFLWQHGLGGILADDMGLGKTLQVLTLVAHARATDPTARPFLVVAPTSVVPGWVDEAARHTPGLRVRAVSASAARRPETIAELAADADVVVTSYTLLRLDGDDYAAVAWEGLVLDEAQQVKNHRSKAYGVVRRIDARFRVAVTGTPFENRLLELWSLLSIVAPGIYPHPRSFVEHVVRPVEDDGDEAALRRFTQRIKPFVLRRTKELVAADLPPKQEQVLTVELTPRHRKVYDTHLAKERQRILGLVDADFDGNRVAILAALTKLRQLALDPALVDEAHGELGSAKLDLLLDHVHELVAEGHRALVFSSFTGYLRRVRDRLAAEGVATTYLDGSTTERAAVIDRFRQGDAPVFLISLKAGGTGLTLTEADYVFVLDPWWNPAAEAQAVDRAHRIGQERTVMVYRLVADDTIEDKVMALKERKAALFARVVDGEGTTARAIDADDIRALFD